MKKNIVITGGSGRFGENLKKVKSIHKLFFPSKNELNILKLKSIDGASKLSEKSSNNMIKPFLHGSAFLTDVRNAASSRDELHIWWIGQSGFLAQWRGEHLLFDPYLSDSLTHKYAKTNKPHVRMTERVISPDQLDFINITTSSHNHTDHLDSETLIPLMQANPEMELLVPSICLISTSPSRNQCRAIKRSI